ncbi:MAG TPA: A/G-specific adenine glycosylase [Alphaproteobacteria bacterium]|nr:A/G-specific adenine glycosylase [Alphaproteobacteria bacterium]
MPDARPRPTPTPPDPADLLAWYDRHRRVLPWRARPGETADPYRVWLSEIMLQQTTVAAVVPYFLRFLARWPTVDALAAAPLDDVLTEWAGLGYYARARNLHACARTVAERHQGMFPSHPDDLARLPGIGAYTAGAIAAIAFDVPAAAVDGNAERVLARLFSVETPLPAAKPKLRALGESLVPEKRAGDFAQALMDLGATICTPRKPACALCPWRDCCAAFRLGIAENLPRRAAKSERPKRVGVAFWIVDGTGAVLLQRRREKGLLGGMMEFPSTEWTAAAPANPAAAAPVSAEWRALPGSVRHVFTHFELTLAVWAGRIAGRGDPALGVWVTPDRFAEHALPSLMRKVARHALSKAAGG